MKTLITIIIKEFHQFRRDPQMLGTILVPPIMQLILMGFPATLDIKSVTISFFDMDNSSKSRELVSSFTSVPLFVEQNRINSYDELDKQMDMGSTTVTVVIPKDFENDLISNRVPKLQAIFNGSDGNTASISAGYVSQIINSFSNDIATELKQKRGNKITPISVNAATRVWYNPEMNSRNFYVPGIVGLLLTIITILLTSLAIVKEKEIGTIEQLIVSPIKSYQLIIGKLVPFVIMSFIIVIIVLSAMRVIFSIEVRGSIMFLFGASFVYILSTLGMGLFISTIAKTQQQAMMIGTFLFMMPMTFFSGFSFPLENMPSFIQTLSIFNPLQYFMNIIRSVVLKGNDFSDHIPDMLKMLVIGVLILTASAMRFRKRLE